MPYHWQRKKKQPKLMVGIIVDQMRPDYLYRFYDQFGEGGFKRLLQDGYNCRNTHYNYVPTVTGPGHATVYTGTTPRYHGIVGNTWYDRYKNINVYCTDDSTEQNLGSKPETMGVSPRNMIATTITDELKMTTNKRGKVIAVSLKDRGAALPAGHMADGAYWFHKETGEFISSTFYMKELPAWVQAFNSRKRADFYTQQVWEPLLPADAYHLSLPDDNNYEEIYKGKDRPTFPYDLKQLAPLNSPYYEVLNRSPFGNSLLTDLALEALTNEGLGKDNYTDMLAISLSSTDAAGHTFGPFSKEINDVYLRLDRDLARLLSALDKEVGKGNYTLFLTSDHAASEVPLYLTDNNLPGGTMQHNKLTQEVKQFLEQKLGQGNWIESLRNNQYYLDRDLLRIKNLDLLQVQNMLAEFLREKEGISRVMTAPQLDQQEYSQHLDERLANGFMYKRSGDVRFELEPGWTGEMKTATTHGSGYAYDTHVPLLWYGAGIPKGESFQYHTITDVAPTVSMLLQIKLPNACTGQAITEVLGK
ncbi:alkaline phosphatase PafA [Pontibacter rugosus]